MKNLASVYLPIFALLISSCLNVISCQESNTREENGIKKWDTDSLYFGQEKPGLIPKVFAPGIISKKDRYEFGFVKSRDGREVFFGVDNSGIMEIYQKKLSASGVF